jgi:hypothetical protein
MFKKIGEGQPYFNYNGELEHVSFFVRIIDYCSATLLSTWTLLMLLDILISQIMIMNLYVFIGMFVVNTILLPIYLGRKKRGEKIVYEIGELLNESMETLQKKKKIMYSSIIINIIFWIIVLPLHAINVYARTPLSDMDFSRWFD